MDSVNIPNEDELMEALGAHNADAIEIREAVKRWEAVRSNYTVRMPVREKLTTERCSLTHEFQIGGKKTLQALIEGLVIGMAASGGYSAFGRHVGKLKKKPKQEKEEEAVIEQEPVSGSIETTLEEELGTKDETLEVLGAGIMQDLRPEVKVDAGVDRIEGKIDKIITILEKGH